MPPTAKQVVAHWSDREDESSLAVDWEEAHERCRRCAYRARLEKCHIVPASLGGTATPDNLVLLCSRCHREAPNHSNLQYMWQWLRATCVPLYDTYWTVRGWEEFEVMFGRKPFATFADAGEDSPASDYRSLLAAEFDQTIIHFGEGRRNPATIACMIAELEQKLATRLGITLPDPPATRARTGPWGI